MTEGKDLRLICDLHDNDLVPALADGAVGKMLMPLSPQDKPGVTLFFMFLDCAIQMVVLSCPQNHPPTGVSQRWLTKCPSCLRRLFWLFLSYPEVLQVSINVLTVDVL